jgi:hypothetical protein
MTELFACLTSWDCERERRLEAMARGSSIVDLAVGSVAALGLGQPEKGEFQVADILYFWAIY